MGLDIHANNGEVCCYPHFSEVAMVHFILQYLYCGSELPQSDRKNAFYLFVTFSSIAQLHLGAWNAVGL